MNADQLYSNKKLVASALSSFLLLLAFPPFSWWPCAFVGLVPLFFVLQHSKRWEAFFLAIIAGIIFFWGSLYWVTHVNLFGCIFLICYCALYWGLFGIVASGTLKQPHSPIRTALTIAVLWCGIEVVRTNIPVLGFGWVLLSFSQINNLAFIQIANSIGATGVSLLIVFLNGLFFGLLTTVYYNRKQCIACGVLLLIVFAGTYAYGHLHLSKTSEGTPLRIGVIQGNIAQADKWNPVLKEKIIEKYVRLIEFISYDAPELILLPEACYPGNFVREHDTSALRRIIEQTRIPVLLGAIRLESITEEYNSAFLISQAGQIAQHYDKIQLVSFGEYVPWKPLFSFFGLTKLAYSLGVGDFKAGKEFTVFTTEGRREKRSTFSTLICFEDIFPHLARSFINHGAQFLVVITNDAWFGDTTAPYQHLHASIFRALENGCYVVRSANTGISGFISPRGQVLDSVRDKRGKETFVTGGISREIFLRPPQTLYRRCGFMLDYLCLAFLIGYTLYLWISSCNLLFKNNLRNIPSNEKC